MKPGLSFWHTTTVLPRPSANVAGSLDRLVGGRQPAHQLDEPHHHRRVEEVGADQPGGRVAGRAAPMDGDRQLRGVGAEQRVAGAISSDLDPAPGASGRAARSTASITTSATSTAAAISVTRVSRPSVASASSADVRPALTKRARLFRMAAIRLG